MMSEINAKPRSVQRKTILSLLVGGIAGGLASFAALTLIDSGWLGQLGTSREIAILVAVVYLVMAASVAFGALSPKLGAQFLNVEDAEELREQKSRLMGSAVATAAFGFALVAVALAAPVGPLAEPVAGQPGAMNVFTTRVAAEEFAPSDPFVVEGVVESWSVRTWLTDPV